MAKNRGILLPDSGRPVVGDTTEQNQMILLLSMPGELKEYPTAGVGLRTFLESGDSDSLARRIRNEFTTDGMTVDSITVNMPVVEIEAEY